MRELDLHGLYHHEVEDEVENFILLYSKELPLRIIIGNSNIMKNISISVLNKHNFRFEISAHNHGEIIVLE